MYMGVSRKKTYHKRRVSTSYCFLLLTPITLPYPFPSRSNYPSHAFSSTIRTYFRLFLQEHRPFVDPAPPAPSSVAGLSAGTDSAAAAGNSGNTTPAAGGSSSAGAGGGGGSGGGSSIPSGPSGGMETLRAFLAGGGVGGGGGGSAAAAGSAGVAGAATGGAAEAAVGGGSGESGAGTGAVKFLLSSKRYRSGRVRSATYIWSKNGVWKVH